MSRRTPERSQSLRSSCRARAKGNRRDPFHRLSASKLLQCMSLFLARNGHADSVAQCPLSGAKRKSYARIEFSGFDPGTDIGSGVQIGIVTLPRASITAQMRLANADLSSCLQ